MKKKKFVLKAIFLQYLELPGVIAAEKVLAAEYYPPDIATFHHPGIGFIKNASYCHF